MVNEENSANPEEKEQGMEESRSLCSSFFQLKGAIEHKNYLRLKNAEKEMIIQYKAASIIQAHWRGFLIRENMKILHASAARIQALLRGAKARKKYRPKILECLALLLQRKLDRAATKIQAAIKGYLSRKNSFDFKKYKAIMRKNSELQRQIQMINEMEELLKKELHVNEEVVEEEEEVEIPKDSSIQSLRGKFGSFISSSSSSSCGRTTDTLDCLVRTSFNELSKSLSKCRIDELLTYVATSASDPLRNNRDSAPSIRRSYSGGANLRVKDSVDDLFPEFPHEAGLVKADPEKVEALKTAIRLLREKIKNENHRRLLKQHYLLRTTNCPGVYSDIYSNDLTEIEKELKGVKFLNTGETRSKVTKPAKTMKKRMSEREPWQPYASKKTDLQNMTMSRINVGAAYTGKNLKRHLNLRKRGANERITANSHTLTLTPTDITRTSTDGYTIEDTEAMYSETDKDGDQSVRAIPNPNTV